MAKYDRVSNTGAGAAKGAAAGSIIGTAILPGAGTAIGGALGAAAGGIKSWMGAEGKDKYQDFLRADVDKLRKGKGGLSGAQQDRFAAASKRDMGQQVGAMQQDIGQKALADGGGYGASGSYSTLIKDMQKSVEDSTAAARWNIQKASMGLAQQKYDATMKRLNQQRVESDKAAEDAMDYILGDDIGETMSNVSQASSFTSGPTAPA